MSAETALQPGGVTETLHPISFPKTYHCLATRKDDASWNQIQDVLSVSVMKAGPWEGRPLRMLGAVCDLGTDGQVAKAAGNPVGFMGFTLELQWSASGVC